MTDLIRHPVLVCNPAMELVMPFTNKEAWLYAATWASYVRSGDPGACMYGFDGRFVVRDEEHRQICLDYAAACKDGIVKGFYLSDEPDHIKIAEKAKLRMLRRALRHAQTDAQYQAAKKTLDFMLNYQPFYNERYQIVARHGHTLDLNKALRIAKQAKARQVKVCHPDMGTWIGTNQPDCVAFSGDAVVANQISVEYGGGLIFVESRRKNIKRINSQ